MTNVVRRLVAEGLGTGLLVASVVGSGIMAASLTQDGAVALLCNAIATGAALVVLITILGPISGAHFNPVVSLVFALRGEISAGLSVLYAGAQVAGAVLGVVIAHAMFAMPLLEIGVKVRTGGGQWLAEAIATFGLIAVVLLGLRARRQAVAWLVGLYITAAYWFTASTSFANPAVSIARALTTSFAGIRPLDVPAFVAAEIAGALVAAGLVTWLLEAEGEKAEG